MTRDAVVKRQNKQLNKKQTLKRMDRTIHKTSSEKEWTAEKQALVFLKTSGLKETSACFFPGNDGLKGNLKKFIIIIRF